MDWPEDMQGNLWIFPRGMKRDGGMGDLGFQWTSQYGSLIVSGYEARTADGMNEKGHYFDDSLSPELVWVDLKRIDVAKGTGMRKLTLHDPLDLGGDQTAGFKAHKPFVFLAPR